MEKVTLFFCDICGTFEMNHSFIIDSSELKKFIENLNKLTEYNNTNKIIFSLVTTENFDIVCSMEKQFKTYIKNDNIYIGKHIYYDGVNEVNKPYDIIEYIKKLELICDIDYNIYYTDDCEFFHLLLNEYLSDKYKINSIIPKNNNNLTFNKV